MDSTRVMLLAEMNAGNQEAWQEFDRLYRPMIRRWLKRYPLQAEDVEDVTQEVLSVVNRRLTEFDHNGHVGAFRHWLRSITIFVTRNVLAKLKRQLDPPASQAIASMLEQLGNSDSDLARQFDREHDQFILGQLLARVAEQFEPATIEAFRRHVVEGVSAAETAAQLGLTLPAVYVAKSRVLRQLREKAAGWVDPAYFS